MKFTTELNGLEAAKQRYSDLTAQRAKKCAVEDSRYTDFYSTLGLEQTCTQRAIKDSYIKLALTHHPDKNRGGLSEEKQKAWANISLAYQYLRDPVTREEYDSKSAIRAAVCDFYFRYNPVSYQL